MKNRPGIFPTGRQAVRTITLAVALGLALYYAIGVLAWSLGTADYNKDPIIAPPLMERI